MDDWCGVCGRQMVELFDCPSCHDAICAWCMDTHQAVEHPEEEEGIDDGE